MVPFGRRLAAQAAPFGFLQGGQGDLDPLTRLLRIGRPGGQLVKYIGLRPVGFANLVGRGSHAEPPQDFHRHFVMLPSAILVTGLLPILGLKQEQVNEPPDRGRS